MFPRISIALCAESSRALQALQLNRIDSFRDVFRRRHESKVN